jgi:hypothetical protein
MIVDLSKLATSLESDFALWRTGEGEAGQWAVIADPTAADGCAIAQVSKRPHRLPLPARGLQTLFGRGSSTVGALQTRNGDSR